ncbi:MAG TPA: heme peroxidase family protein [Pyrinomonadaceae bacterium]|nr:heme peroxidase family protein [Pyrinomonadaceae bacterium]
MPRIPHGAAIPLSQFREAREAVIRSLGELSPLAFAVARPVDLQDFDFMFRRLQSNPAFLLPEGRKTRDDLVRLGRAMRETRGDDPAGDSRIPAVFTYLGQFIDHDITLETVSAELNQLLDPGLKPLSLQEIQEKIRNARTATLDLDSLYNAPAPRVGPKMTLGQNTRLNGTAPPTLRPPGKDDDNDLPREPRSKDIAHDRAALIGDPRNDENTIVSQLHTAFLRAHNALVGRGLNFAEARRQLTQHYQYIILNEFLPSIADPQIVNQILRYGNKFYLPTPARYYMPLEFAVAAYRFGHSMVRSNYDFNLNFNTSGAPGTFPASLQLLFTFTALSGQLGDFDTLPDNWIIQWENFVGAGRPVQWARRIDTKLVEPLFELRDLEGNPIQPPDGGRLAVRNLLRGYRLRMPTGQAVARVVGVPALTPAELTAVAAAVPPAPGEESQLAVMRDSVFLRRTPLWYYVLAEGAARGGGNRLGPVGSTIVAEVLIGLIRRGRDSILSQGTNWRPTLPSERPGRFTLADLLRLAGVLRGASWSRSGGGATKKGGAAQKSAGKSAKRSAPAKGAAKGAAKKSAEKSARKSAKKSAKKSSRKG